MDHEFQALLHENQHYESQLKKVHELKVLVHEFRHALRSQKVHDHFTLLEDLY